MVRYDFQVAGHVFTIESAQAVPVELEQYAPFAVDKAGVDDDHRIFTLRVVEGPVQMTDFRVEMTQDDDGSQIRAGRLGHRLCFEFLLFGEQSAVLLCGEDCREDEVVLVAHQLFGLNNALMVMYALATAGLRTALFHSSVVSLGERAYMFLGRSGTGKSTHSRLWLSHIGGTELVNDDNPVVRIGDDGVARVYGSPWSGKTPCYRNVAYRLGAIVGLSQAPHNAIRRLGPIEAYALVVPSISGMRWERRIADGLHEMESLLVSQVPVWHLDCLPDEAAARLCAENVAV